MRHGEHAVHGINDLPGNGGPARTRHWRPSGRVWHATQRAAIAAALIGLGYGLASVLDRAPLNVADLGVASLASSALACAEGGGGAQKNLLDGHTDEELPEIRPHSDDYWHMTFKRQVEEMINATIAGGFELLLYGDSITEQLRDLGGPCGHWGCPEGGDISRKHLGMWRSLNMGIGGEPSWSMLYRMRNGALPGRDAGAKVVVIHTGTNDIGFDTGRALQDPRGHADDIIKRIAAMTRLVRSRVPAATVILLGIFPRTWDGGDYKGRKYAKDVWPNPLSQVMKMVYAGLTVVAERDDKVVQHECSQVFVVNRTIPHNLMHDGLHPSNEGQDLWAKCLAERVRDFITR